MANTPLHDLEKIPGFDNTPSTDPESANALDAALKAAGGDPNSPDAGVEPVAKEKAPPKEKPAAPVKVEEVPLKELQSGSDALDELMTPKEEKPAPKEEKVTPKEEKITPKVADEFDAIELPTTVKPKTIESFDKVKSVARERIASVTKEKEALAKEVETLKTKVTEGLPKEVEAELKTLREFRAKLDVEADPNFLSYDKTVSDNTESIYAKLLATPGIDQKQIDAIKALGGPGEVDWDAPGVKLPSHVRRFIDAKLVESESALEKKTKAIADAKSNAEQYLSVRREEQTKGAEAQNKAVESEIETLLPKFSWFKELKAKDGATEDEKKSIDEHNKLIETSRATFKDAISDNSPAMRAILAVGYAQLLKTRADFSAFKAGATAKEAASAAEKAELTKEVEELKSKLDKIKRSSTTRLRDTPAEENSGKSKQVDISTPGSDALDKHRDAVLAARE